VSRWLRLGAAATLAGIDFLPVAVALDARFHLGQPVGFGWLTVSIAVAWAGWRLGRRGAPAGSAAAKKLK